MLDVGKQSSSVFRFWRRRNDLLPRFAGVLSRQCWHYRLGILFSGGDE